MRLVNIFILSFILTSCVSTSHYNKYYKVRNHKPRKSTLGFSVVPPPGKYWYEKLKDDSLYYLKVMDTNHLYSILTEAREVNFKRIFTDSELKDYVQQEKGSQITKYSNIRQSYELRKPCVEYYQSYQDDNDVNVVVSGLYCVHPNNKMVGVDVSYTEKSLSDTETISYRQEGEIFINSLDLL